MTQFDKFISLYHTFCEGGDDNTTDDQVDTDKLCTYAVNLEEQDQLYAMLTKSKEIEQSQQRPGNINCLLSKAHGKG